MEKYMIKNIRTSEINTKPLALYRHSFTTKEKFVDKAAIHKTQGEDYFKITRNWANKLFSKSSHSLVGCICHKFLCRHSSIIINLIEHLLRQHSKTLNAEN